MDQNKFHEAIQIYSNILGLDQNNIAALFGYGDALTKLKEFQQALEQYRKIKKLKKDLILVFLKIGLTLGSMGQNKKAIKYFVKAQNEIMEDHKLEWTQSKQVEINELLRQTINYFNIQSLNNEELLVYAHILIHTKHFDEAQHILNQLKSSSPNNDLLFCLEADILFVSTKFDEAEQLLKKAVRINPNRCYTWVKLTTILIIQGKYEEALSQLDNVILKAFPYNLDSLFFRSDILSVLQQFQEAIVGYDKCISCNQHYRDAYKSKAVALRRLKQYDEALKIYDFLLQDDLKNFDMLYEKACTLMEMQEYDAAHKMLDQVLVLQPNNLDAQVKQGDILLKIGLFDDSLEIYEKVLSIKPNHFFALWGKSESLRGMQKFNESLIWYDTLLKQRPLYPYAYHYKGLALQQLNRHKEAINNFIQALSIHPELQQSKEALQISQQKLAERK
ncbi:unnamed protein product [Paramecium octaurelia]|uniref:Tetratricopeptide repeat protein n=1 Tax=Paramecium octaurelia TaxID=43137 RepID=A0A8S1UNH8_PAROT|nr:unnamed protein product [Paramecium octaurelia]